MPPPVFITARFRTGSTMLWNIFRQVPEVVAYYEPLHEKLPQWITAKIPPQPDHYYIEDYFREYPPVEKLSRYHSAEFGVCRLYLEAEESFLPLKEYIQYLLEFAGIDKMPVLQCNRIDFRLPWVRANFPDALLLHLYRSPRDQWCSSIDHYPQNVDDDLEADPYLITTWARTLWQQFPFLASSFIRHPYQRHYYLWKLSYLVGSRLADVSVSYEEILASPERSISTLLHMTGLNIQENLERCLAVIVQKPVNAWKHYRNEGWFANLEEECETTLTNLGLNQQFGEKSLSEIIAANREYQQLVTNLQISLWAIRSSQIAIIDWELISEEKELVLQELHSVADQRLRSIRQLEWRIRHLESHPLRLVLKRYLPDCIQSGLRRIRKCFQPQLGQFHQYPPIPLKIPVHSYSISTISSQQSLPVVSIVTPSLNQVQFLEKTITSVLEQGYPKLEYIIQDGASKDGTDRILEKYRHKLTHLESYQDKGQAHAINQGFQHISGDIMAWLNSDDLLLPGTVAYIVHFFLKHPDVDVVYGHRIIIDEHDYEIGRWILPSHDDNMLLWADYIPQETLFWRKRIWEKAGGYVDESFHFALDWEMLLRFREAGATFVRLPRFLAAFRVHSQQKTSQHLEGFGLEEMARLRKQLHGRDISNEEALHNIRDYMRKHVLYEYLFRLRILRI